MCFNIFIRCTNIDMSSDHIIRSCQIYWTVFHPFFMDFASWFFLRPPLPHLFIAPSHARQWHLSGFLDNILTIPWPYTEILWNKMVVFWVYEALWGFVAIFLNQIWYHYDYTITLMCVFHLHSLCTGNTPPTSHIIPFVPFLDPTYYKIPARWPIFW